MAGTSGLSDPFVLKEHYRPGAVGVICLLVVPAIGVPLQVCFQCGVLK